MTMIEHYILEPTKEDLIRNHVEEMIRNKGLKINKQGGVWYIHAGKIPFWPFPKTVIRLYAMGFTQRTEVEVYYREYTEFAKEISDYLKKALTVLRVGNTEDS